MEPNHSVVPQFGVESDIQNRKPDTFVIVWGKQNVLPRGNTIKREAALGLFKMAVVPIGPFSPPLSGQCAGEVAPKRSGGTNP